MIRHIRLGQDEVRQGVMGVQQSDYRLETLVNQPVVFVQHVYRLIAVDSFKF
ncbi:hypothetical protein D3C71_2219300 [compost metagenome]